MSYLDWAIMAVSVILLRMVSMSTRHCVKGVADFLSANRSAGRYLLTVSGQMGSLGVVSMIAFFEMGYEAGFPPAFWGFMQIPVGAVILLTGWVYYRFRETRALTMAQFMEMRYNKGFRVFAGCLMWLSGILNFAIFPAIAAHFFVYFCGLPDHFHPIPGLHLQMSTFATVMAVDLGAALVFVNMGGQVSVMVTECFQGIFCNFVFVAVSVYIMMHIGWSQVQRAYSMAPANASMMNPFHTSAVKDFNVWYFLIGIVGAFYGYLTWQGSSGFNSAGRTPHEQKMGGILGLWRAMPLGLMVTMLIAATVVILRLPEHASLARTINGSLGHIADVNVRGEMRVPMAMAMFLPSGMRGLLATVMLFASFTCHDTYMHSWGSIFVQDVYMPFKKRVLGPEEHIRLLKWSIFGVALFAFIWGVAVPLPKNIFMYFAITGTIWCGGAGAVIIGGLYWKKGTTLGAYAATITGSVIGLGGLFVPDLYKAHFHRDFPINGQWLFLIGMVASAGIYVISSLIVCRKKVAVDLERMLHRGKYADPKDETEKMKEPSRWQQLMGITNEFSLGDRVLAIALMAWNAGFFGFFVVTVIINLLHPVSESWWSGFWHFYLNLFVWIGTPAAVFLAVGGIVDIRGLFKTLENSVRDHSDDGSVPTDNEAAVVSEDTCSDQRTPEIMNDAATQAVME